MAIYLSLLVCLIGAMMYGFATNPKLIEVGRLMFTCGLLAFLIVAWPVAVGVGMNPVVRVP